MASRMTESGNNTNPAAHANPTKKRMRAAGEVDSSTFSSARAVAAASRANITAQINDTPTFWKTAYGDTPPPGGAIEILCSTAVAIHLAIELVAGNAAAAHAALASACDHFGIMAGLDPRAAELAARIDEAEAFKRRALEMELVRIDWALETTEDAFAVARTAIEGLDDGAFLAQRAEIESRVDAALSALEALPLGPIEPPRVMFFADPDPAVRIGSIVAPPGVTPGSVAVGSVPPFGVRGENLTFYLAYTPPPSGPATTALPLGMQILPLGGAAADASLGVTLASIASHTRVTATACQRPVLKLTPPAPLLKVWLTPDVPGCRIRVTVQLPGEGSAHVHVLRIESVVVAGQVLPLPLPLQSAPGDAGGGCGVEDYLDGTLTIPLVQGIVAPQCCKPASGRFNEYATTPVILPAGALYVPQFIAPMVQGFSGCGVAPIGGSAAPSGVHLEPLPVVSAGLSIFTLAAAYDARSGSLLLADDNARVTELVAIALNPASASCPLPPIVRWRTRLPSGISGLAALPSCGVVAASAFSASTLHIRALSDGGLLASIAVSHPAFLAADDAAGVIYASAARSRVLAYQFHPRGHRGAGATDSGGGEGLVSGVAMEPPTAESVDAACSLTGNRPLAVIPASQMGQEQQPESSSSSVSSAPSSLLGGYLWRRDEERAQGPLPARPPSNLNACAVDSAFKLTNAQQLQVELKLPRADSEPEPE
jgi:hypothetical protein